MKPCLILLFALLATAGLYWAGLRGPFILDDSWNLEPIRLWLDGQASLHEVIFPYSSFVFSRPVAMGSFVLTTWLFGDESFSFKLGNLIIHLACGVIGWAVLRRGLLHDARLSPHAELLAALAATFWLLHPMHVSTVLYAVQRMAQLSTFFTLAAVLMYLVARQQMIEGRARPAWLNLFVAFPLLVLLGLLSKQNAAIAPALCLVFELAYFNKQTRTGSAIKAFFGMFLALPLLGVTALLIFAPQKLLATYADWDFTLWERLLTQSRALVDYLGMLLIPRGPLMGLYTDDFAVSHGLLAPVSTLLSILALAAISIAAIAVRKRAPSVFAGWFFFLVAHGVESGFLPLEMYYEHRNYLPSFGLMLAVFGLVALAPAFRTNVLSPRKLGLFAVTGFILILCMATLGRVLVWQDLGTIAQLGVKTHPDSLRARFDVSVWALGQKDYETALDSMRYLAASDSPRHRQMGNLSIVIMNCMRGVGEGSMENLRLAAAANLSKLTTYEAQAFGKLSSVTKDKECGDLKRSAIAASLQEILNSASSQPETAAPQWFARYALAEIYVRDGQWIPAQIQAEKAWRGGHDKKVGIFLINIYLHNNQWVQADSLLAELDRIVSKHDKQAQGAMATARNFLHARARKSLEIEPSNR